MNQSEAAGWLRRRTSEQTAAHPVRTGDPAGPVHTVRVDGRSCPAVSATLDAFASALDFPAYYGHNSDAFIECLSDLLVVEPGGGVGSQFGDRAGISARAVTVEVDNAQDFLPRADDLAAFSGLVDYALDRPAPAGAEKLPFTVVLVTRPE